MKLETMSRPDRAFLLLKTVLVVLLAGCTVDIHHDLEETEADDIIVLLEANGIAASKEEERGGDWSVNVPVDDASRSYRIMRAHGLPPRAIDGWDAVLDDSSIVQSPAEERARFLLATAGALEATLRSTPGVVDARVHLALPLSATNPFDSANPSRSGGSVFLLQEPIIDEDCISVSDVQRLVAGAVDGVEPEDVFVVYVPWELSSSQEGVNELARLGPFGVTRGSHRPLQMLLVVLCGLILVFGGLVAIRLRRNRAS